MANPDIIDIEELGRVFAGRISEHLYFEVPWMPRR